MQLIFVLYQVCQSVGKGIFNHSLQWQYLSQEEPTILLGSTYTQPPFSGELSQCRENPRRLLVLPLLLVPLSYCNSFTEGRLSSEISFASITGGSYALALDSATPFHEHHGSMNPHPILHPQWATHQEPEIAAQKPQRPPSRQLRQVRLLTPVPQPLRTFPSEGLHRCTGIREGEDVIAAVGSLALEAHVVW